MTPQTVVTLREHEELRAIEASAFSDEWAQLLLDHYSKQVTVEWPTPKTRGCWSLRAGSWIGHIPVGPRASLVLEPKVALANLFHMLALVYDLDELQFPEGVTSVSAIGETYQQLAVLLSRRVLDRARKGLYRDYRRRREHVPYVRGRVDFENLARRPIAVEPVCHFDEHSVDIPENRILAWTLHAIARGGICTGQALATVRKASRVFHGSVELQRVRPQDCVGLLYHRQNIDYRTLHGLCRFFLECAGPGATRGSRTMLPFLVKMPTLFERFVARWLGRHLPSEYRLQSQETVSISRHHGIEFRIDLVLRERGSGRPLAVLDTKYKPAQPVKTGDLQQIIAYAHLTGSPEAWLIFPEPSSRPLDVSVEGIRIRTAAFDLNSEDLDRSGGELMARLGMASRYLSPGPPARVQPIGGSPP